MTANNAIAVDTSIFICYLQKETGDDIEILRRYLNEGDAWFCPIVVTELLSAPKISKEEARLIGQLPMLEIDGHYWHRAGKTRSVLLQKGHKARLADALIAQSCIDHDIPLLTRDMDFKHYAKHCGLKLAKL